VKRLETRRLVEVEFVVVPFTIVRFCMVDEPLREIPAVVVVGVRNVPLYDQLETPSAPLAAFNTPFVILRPVPVMSVM
jgi:hypothetical protein